MSEVQTPATKRHDPSSSHAAEREVTASGRRACQQELVTRLVQHLPGRTSKELANLAGVDRVMVARRLPECETAGKVKRGRQRPTAGMDGAAGGRSSVTWWPVEDAE